MNDNDVLLISQVKHSQIFKFAKLKKDHPLGKRYFMRYANGYLDMSNGDFEMFNPDNPYVVKVVSDYSLTLKFKRGFSWVEAWKEQIIKIHERNNEIKK